ncbi:alpha/beta hydrolase [Paenibacillus sp. 32O-W]|uniref:Alpha/beta hydrolase n=1 Tax=Paenibacillus cisolokensis TaxID=1658519 RepID=A0ABQ4NCS7_9BACL|nr:MULTISPECIES: alpha/beta hydrolase [Paenibacillus]ALS30048.1 alpha/beta hydrolase [Paenibacillus sp. 32O-W]GIQ66027.1 alpha/beta hydrolase [Paenibacillus cisolokensis]
MSTSIAPLDGRFSPELLPLPQPPEMPNPDYAVAGRSIRRKNVLIAFISATLALVLLTVLAFHAYVAWLLAYPYVASLGSDPKTAKGLDYENVTFPSRSGRTTVSAWFIPAADRDGALSESRRTIVFSHGYGANREETWVPMYDLAELLHRLNYNILMFDYGYASEQYRAPATGGWEESQQLLASVDYAKSRGAEDIIVWGFSMGAGTALQAALYTDQIDAMILDSLFLPSSDTLFSNVTQFVNLPKFPSKLLIEAMLPLWTGTTVNRIPSGQIMNKTYDMPIYVIHGTEDAKAPYQTAEQIGSRQSNPLSRTWIVPGGQHELLYRAHPKEYIQRAALFLSQVDQNRTTAGA